MDQVFAIAWLRSRLFFNRLRREQGTAALAGGAIVLLISLLFSAGMALGLWFAARTGIGEANEGMLRLAFLGAFWMAVVFGLLMPLVLATGNSGVETSRLLLFPISRRKLFTICWGSAFLSPDHLFYYPALATTFLAGVLLPGTGTAIALGGALYLLSVVVVVSWAQAVMAALQGVLGQRRIREVIGIVGFGLLVVAGLLPAVFARAVEGSGEERAEEFFVALGGLLRFLPPNLATEGLVAVHLGETGTALESLCWLAVWAGLGIFFAYQAFTRIALGARGGGGERTDETAGESGSRFDITERLPFIPADVLGVASKEVRYLLRSAIGKFNLAMIAVFVAIVAYIVLPTMEAAVYGVDARELALYGMLWYVVLFSNNIVNNSVGWEGAGFKMYLLSPVPYHRIVLGKNLGIWAYNAVLLGVCLFAWFCMVGWPGFETLLGAILLFAGVQVLFVTAGNFISLSFPVARDISSMKCTPAQSAIFLSLFIMLGIGILGLIAVAAPIALGAAAWRPVFLLCFFLASLLVYRISLGPIAEHLSRRKDRIVEILEGATK